ncbi:hypothetical protein P9112_000532 [Eukaryota sp. TZLM1-RC]
MTTIRIIYQQKQHTITLSPNASVHDLQTKVEQVTAVPPPDQHFLTGFPPSPLDLSAIHSISSLNRSTLHLRHSSGSSPPPSSSQPLMAHRVLIEADNSCLFNAVSFLHEGLTTGKSDQYRSLVLDYILENSDDFSEAVLERPVQDYIQALLDPASWGGYIELVALSNVLGIEIVSVDVEHLNFLRYSPKTKASRKGFVIFSGIHYDAVEIERGGSRERLVEVEDEEVEVAVMELAKELNMRHDFINVNKFSLKCSVCFKGLVGQRDAVDHARETGHSDFQEFKK